MSVETCLNIIAIFLICVGFWALLNYIASFLHDFQAIEQRKRYLEAEEKCREYEYRRAKEDEERRRKEENWDNIRPRWEEHIKYFNRLHEEQRSHLQVSFKEDKSNETMDD